MDRTERTIVLRCYIEGRADTWRAICVDLDIAAQGYSMAETKNTLEEMVNTYIEAALEAEPHEREAMLRRKSPLFVRLKCAAGVLRANLFANTNDDDRMNYVSHRACSA